MAGSNFRDGHHSHVHHYYTQQELALESCEENPRNVKLKPSHAQHLEKEAVSRGLPFGTLLRLKLEEYHELEPQLRVIRELLNDILK